MKKQLSLFLAACMMCGIITGCANNQNNENSGESSQTLTVTAEQSLSSAEETEDFFGNEYDPFSDDYNPYGDNASNASALDSPSAETLHKASETSAETGETYNIKPEVTAAKSTDSLKPAVTTAKAQSKSKLTETAPKNNSSSDVSLELSYPNGWENGSDKFIQLDGKIKNSGSQTISGWSAVIEVGSGASIDQSWNCSLSLNGGKLTVTPVDYNNEVTSNNEATFGMILKNAGNIDSSKAVLKYGGTSAPASGGNSSSGNNGGGSSQSGSVGNNNPEIKKAKNVPAPTTDDWLYVKGNKIYDKDGKEVWLTGVNWFGYNTGTNTFDGLWACDLNTSIASIADHGFNLLRIPISTELIKQWSNGEYPAANFNQATNSYLVGMNSLEIFDYVIGQCRANGLKIMIDIHCAKTDSMGHMKNMWYEGNITEKDYLDALNWIAKRYKSDDTIIAYDLENEPHGKANENPRAKWDSSKDSDNWKYIAEKAANSVLKANPNVLVMVEGIEIYPKDIKKNGDFSSTNPGDYHCTWWGGNLRGVRDNPVDLGKYQNKLVYSPHDYGPSVYQQPWFQGGYNFNSLYNDCWYDNWFYIQKEGVAPLLIGEWGGFMTEPNITWMTYLRKLIKDNKINHTFWCFNSNSGDTGGLVKDDFTTWDTEKYNFVKEVLWQQDGKFVGLDHEIPLGSNGITLTEAK